MLLLKQQTQDVNDRIPAKGCRHPLVTPWTNDTGKRNHVPTMSGAIISDKGEITGTSKSIRRLMTAETTPEARTELHPVEDEMDEATRLLEEAHLEVQAAKSKVAEAACRVRKAMDDMAKIKRLMEASLESADR